MTKYTLLKVITINFKLSFPAIYLPLQMNRWIQQGKVVLSVLTHILGVGSGAPGSGNYCGSSETCF